MYVFEENSTFIKGANFDFWVQRGSGWRETEVAEVLIIKDKCGGRGESSSPQAEPVVVLYVQTARIKNCVSFSWPIKYNHDCQ